MLGPVFFYKKDRKSDDPVPLGKLDHRLSYCRSEYEKLVKLKLDLDLEIEIYRNIIDSELERFKK